MFIVLVFQNDRLLKHESYFATKATQIFLLYAVNCFIACLNSGTDPISFTGGRLFFHQSYPAYNRRTTIPLGAAVL